MIRARSRPPLWFLLLVTVVAAWALRSFATPAAWGAGGGGHEPEVHVAFWPFVVFVAGLIWKGIEVAGRVTLEVLKWVVVNLSLVVTKVVNGLKDIGSALLLGLRKSWDFLKLTYDKVLKPGWEKFWRWFDRFRKWLDDTFGPVLQFLRRVRDNLLAFWKTYIRPWIDLIDVTRRVLRVLNTLGLKWAGQLDAELGRIEDAIERPFRLLLAKVNEVINLVNRVVTLDGLLQRIALMRSLLRDYQYAWRAIVNPYSHPVDQATRDAVHQAAKGKTLATVQSELREWFVSGGGAAAPIVTESAAQWRLYLRGPAPEDAR